MNETQHALVVLGEELGEFTSEVVALGSVLVKEAEASYSLEDILKNLQEEWNDVLFCVGFLEREGVEIFPEDIAGYGYVKDADFSFPGFSEVVLLIERLLYFHKRVSKALRFGLGERMDGGQSNSEILEEHWGSILWAVSNVFKPLQLEIVLDHVAQQRRRDKVAKFKAYSEELGQLSKPE